MDRQKVNLEPAGAAVFCGRGPRRSRARARPRGFVLIEVALATIIIGLAVVALLTVIGAATRANGDNRDLTKAVFLAQEIREMLAPVPTRDPSGAFGPGPGETTLPTWDDYDDFHNRTFSPPINAQRQTLSGPEWTGWSQSITVKVIDPNYLAGHEPLSGGWVSDMARVLVTVRKGGSLVHQLSWVITVNEQEEGE